MRGRLISIQAARLRTFSAASRPKASSFIRHEKLAHWAKAPGARECHPREEHLLPLMVVAGAAGADKGKRDYHDMIANKVISGYRFG